MATQVTPTGIQNNSSSIENITLATDGGVDVDSGHLVVTHGGNVTVNSPLQVESTLNITGNTTLGGTLTVTGNVIFNGALLDLNSNLDLTGNSTFTGTVGVTGNSTFTGDVDITGDLTVDTDALFVDTSTNRVGIGDTVLDSKLHVVESTVSGKTTVLTLEAPGTVADDGPAIDFIPNGSSVASASIVGARPDFSGTDGYLGFYTNDATTNSEKARIDSNGRLLINKVSSTVVSSHENQIQLQGDDQAKGRMSIIRTSVDNGGAGIHLCKSRGLSGSSYNLPNDGDQVGILVANAASDSPSISKQIGSIQFFVDGAPTINNIPGRLGLYTTTISGNQPSEKFTIDSKGAITQTCYLPIASLTTVLYAGAVTDNAQSGNATFNVSFTFAPSATSNYFMCEIIGYHPSYTADNEYFRFLATQRAVNDTYIVSIIDDLSSTGSSTSATGTTVTFTGRRPRSNTNTSLDSVIQVIYRGIEKPTNVTIANT